MPSSKTFGIFNAESYAATSDPLVMSPVNAAQWHWPT